MLTTPFLHIMRTNWPLKANCGNWVLFVATALFLTYSCSVPISSPVVSILFLIPNCFLFVTLLLPLDFHIILAFLGLSQSWCWYLSPSTWGYFNELTVLWSCCTQHCIFTILLCQREGQLGRPYWRTNTELGKYLKNINKQKQKPTKMQARMMMLKQSLGILLTT